MASKAALAVLLLCATIADSGQVPALSEPHRADAKRMLASLHRAIRDGYYDPKYHGIDLDAHFKAAAAKLDGAQTLPHAYGIIAQSLMAFEDSHTFFIPPVRSASVEYGWDMRMIADRCFITAVRPGSDAETKGLRRGDRLLQLDQFLPARGDFWKLRYLIYTLSPRSRTRLVVQSPGDAAPRTLDIAAKVTPQPRVIDVDLSDLEGQFYREMREARQARNQMARAGTVSIWKLSGFDFDPDDVDRLFDSAVREASALVIDMRGNGGGLVKTLEQLAGRLFNRDVTLATVKSRKAARPLLIKKRKSQYEGKIAVLIDANSASAAEVLARVLQLEQRGVVIGDRSAGAVMQGQVFTDGIPGARGVMLFHASITNADLIMSDGKSLERSGVVPDELLLPSAADLAAGRDPVLARAVALVGGSLDPAAAGAMFPIQWK